MYPRMRNVLKAMSTIVIGCVVIASGSSPGLARQDNGTIRISGRVSPALKLSVGGDIRSAGGTQAAVKSQGLDSIQIEFSGDGSDGSRRVTIPLELRTNVGYELRLAQLSSSRCRPGLTASVGSIEASGAAVMSGAAETSRRIDVSDIGNLSTPTSILIGPRISARGNFTSAGNALLVALDIAGAEGSGPGCRWRVSLSISLHPGASF
jgi:hypothetical protein